MPAPEPEDVPPSELLATPSFTLPETVTDDWASATAGMAATTASARSDFFIEISPRCLESIDGPQTVATPRWSDCRQTRPRSEVLAIVTKIPGPSNHKRPVQPFVRYHVASKQRLFGGSSDGEAMEQERVLTGVDRLLALAGRSLATLASAMPAQQPLPAGGTTAAGDSLDETERRLSAALMRVNHVGEICAQALYEGQAASTRDPMLRERFLSAAREEADHLAWTRQRIEELGGRTSLLNPLWYGGALTLGVIAGRLGDRVSLGFMAETERQVEQHLESHLDRLPSADERSRAIVRQMKDDEVRHAETAMALGGVEFPAPVRGLMKLAAKVMTTTAHRL